MKIEDLLGNGMRALFCVGITEAFFNATPEETREIGAAIKEAFDDLEGRFGVKVLGTFDDDLIQCGTTTSYPYISYILAEIPDFEAVVHVTNIIRTPYKDGRLAKYLTIQSRVGRPLFFGTR